MSINATQEPTTLQPTSDSVNVAHDLTTLITNSSTLPPTGLFDGILVAVASLMGGVTILITIGTATVVVCVVWFRRTRMGRSNSTSHVHVAAQPQNQGISVCKKCYGA